MECLNKDPFYKDKCVEDEHKLILETHQKYRVGLLNGAREFRMDSSMYDHQSSFVFRHCMELDREIEGVDFPDADIPSEIVPDDHDHDQQVSTQCL